MSHASLYGASGEITGPQKVAEMMCERIAAHEGKALTTRFWSTKAWSRVYAEQVRHVHRLTKIYDIEAVFRVLRDNARIRSLGPAFVSDLVRVEQAKLDLEIRQANQAARIETSDVNVAPPQRVKVKSSIRDRLGDL